MEHVLVRRGRAERLDGLCSGDGLAGVSGADGACGRVAGGRARRAVDDELEEPAALADGEEAMERDERDELELRGERGEQGEAENAAQAGEA